MRKTISMGKTVAVTIWHLVTNVKYHTIGLFCNFLNISVLKCSKIMQRNCTYTDARILQLS